MSILVKESFGGATRHRAGVIPYNAVAIGVALVLFLSAGAKLGMVSKGDRAGNLFRIMQVAGEFLLGTWLVSFKRPRQARLVSIALFTVFLGVNAISVFRGERECGCFGDIQTHPAAVALLDISALVCLVLARGLPASASPKFLVWAVLGWGILAGTAWVMRPERLEAISDPKGRSVVLEPGGWVGQRAPILPYVELDGDVGKGSWRVILYRQGCEACQRTMAKVEDPSKVGRWIAAGYSVAALEVEGSTSSPAGSGGSLVHHGQLRQNIGWIVGTPVMVESRDGVVSKVWEGEATIEAALEERS